MNYDEKREAKALLGLLAGGVACACEKPDTERAAEALRAAFQAGLDAARDAFMRADVGRVWTSYAAAEHVRRIR